MSERTFFTLRYALPGYTFILLSILVAFPKLIEILLQASNDYPLLDLTIISAFLAFFTLLSGSALGFLVSQVWYFFYHWRMKGRYRCLPRVMGFIIKKYHLDATRDKLDHRILFLDYIHRLSDKETLNYVQRRFDLMHLCGSTLVSTILGSIFGLMVRLHFLAQKLPLQRHLI